MWDDGHNSRALTHALLGTSSHACYVLVTELKTVYTKLSETASPPGLRKVTEQGRRESLRNE